MPVLPVPSTRWLVGVSGGGDSMALLHLLVQSGWGPAHMVVGHVNHGWGPWGQTAESFVQAACAAYGVPFRVRRGGGRPASNAEATARAERHRFFATWVKEESCAGVMLAHTQTDVHESALMRLGKGSGLAGLTSPLKEHQVVNGLALWRPLLGVTRAHLRAYLSAQGQTWLDDPADAAQTNQRARLRAAMPQLAGLGLTPEGLQGALENLKRAEEALQSLSLRAFKEVCLNQTDTRIQFDRPRLLSQPEEIGQRLLAMGLEKGGGLLPRTSKRLALLSRVREEPSGKATLGTCHIQWTLNTVDISL